MNNIRVKQESLNNWRKEFSINEEIEGGISVQNVADGLNFTEIETVDIIKPEPIKGSSDIEEGVSKVIKQVVKSPGVRRFVSNLSKSSKVKIVSPKSVITPGSTLGSGGKFAANHFYKVPTQAGSSYVPKHVRYLDDMMDKSKRGLTGAAGAGGFAKPSPKSVKVYMQPSYANPKKYPGDKTGAYARELARQDNTARIGKNSSINRHGISRSRYYSTDGINTVGGKVKLKTLKGLEDENLEFLKKMKNESYNNWQLEMAVESLISEGYNDNEIVTILTEELPKVPLGGIVTGAVRAAWNLSSKGVKGAYDLGKGARGVVNRGIRDTKLTKDILDTAKKLRQPKLPQGVEVVKKSTERGGGIARSFKGFMQNVKNRATKIRNSSKQEIQSTAKDVDVLGGAATNPATKVKPMKNITPSPIGDGIKKVTNQIKTGATAAAVTGGVVAGSKLTGGSPSKVAPAAPITNDGKKTVDPSKNEKIDTPPTKRELRNKRNDALSSKEGKRARRDARLQKKKDSGFPSRRMKSGTPVNQLFNKEEKDIKENIGFQQSAMRKTDTGKGPLGNFSVRNVLKPERDKLLAKALPSVGGVQVKMDADGMVPNAGAFAQQTVSKELKNIGSSSIAKNNPMIQKGLEVAGKENANTEFNINKNIPGTQANRFQGVADSINTNTNIKNPKKKTIVQGTSSTRPMGEGFVSKALKFGIGGFLASKGLEKLKKSVDNKLDDARKNMKIGGDKRKSDIEKATGVKLDHYSWRDELGLMEEK